MFLLDEIKFDECGYMKKKIIKLIIILLFIFNLVVGALLIFDIQIMEAPETTIKIDIIEINADEAVLQTIIDISNPNIFELVTKDFEITTTSPDGFEVASILLEGGSIPPGENITYNTVDVIAFNDVSPDLLNTKMTGKVGLSIGFIQKTIPLSINVITSVKDAIKKYLSPSLNIQVEFGELTQKGINLTGEIGIYNPNKIDIFIDNVSLIMETETGKNVGNIDIEGGEIESEGSLLLKSTGILLLEVLNAKSLSVKLTGNAGARIAGINESVSFSSDLVIKVPDLSTLLTIDNPTNLIIKADFLLTSQGLEDTLIFEVHNPNKIAIEIRDIVFTLTKINNQRRHLLHEIDLEDGIVKAENTKIWEGKILISFAEIILPIGERLLPEELEIKVTAKISLPGINQSFWIGISGIQDFRLLK